MTDDQVSLGLYEEITDFYMFLVNSIELIDYKTMKVHLGYTESYEDYIKSLTAYIPPKETTIQQIDEFLKKYEVFDDINYVRVLQNLNRRVHENAEICKAQAYQILQRQSTVTASAPTPPTTHLPQDTVTAVLKDGTISMYTHRNPLLVSLYSLLIVWYSLTVYGTSPLSVI